MNIYELSRCFWNWSFENPDLVKPNHSAMFFFAIEHCNRLGWKEKFGFPTTMVMDAIGIKSYNTFIATLNDLVKWGFISMIERSKNQYSANIIAISKFNEANDKALDEALLKHLTKQSESTIQSTVQSIDSIDIQTYNTTNLQTYNVLLEKEPKQEEVEIEVSEEFFPEAIPIDDLANETEQVIKQPDQEKRKKVAQKKEIPKPPDIEAFVDTAREIYQNELKLDFSLFEFAVRAKYDSWNDAGWKDGHKKPIQGWKNKLRNVIPYLKPIYGKSINNNSNNGSNTIRAGGNKIDGTTQLLNGEIRYFEAT